MSRVEKRLQEGSEQMQAIHAPKELEDRLRKALGPVKPKRRKLRAPLWITAAAVVLLSFLISYNHNAVAFYGKKLLGFDEVMTGTLKELNEKGLGQAIGIEKQLIDGSKLTIDGVMADDNQFILYYTIENPNGMDDMRIFTPIHLTGLFTDSFAEGGSAHFNEDKTEAKGMHAFKPVSAFAKELTLHFTEYTEEGQGEFNTVTFPYNPNLAFQSSLKQSIKKKVAVDKGTITFKSITATPTMTMIEGKIDIENFNRLPLALNAIELIANGEPVQLLGSGSETGPTGTKFDIRFDGLPDQIDSLKIVMKEFVGYETLDERIALTTIGDEPVSLKGKGLYVKSVTKVEDQIHLRISTDSEVLLDDVAIEANGIRTPLKTTTNQTYTDKEGGTVLKERTLIFETGDVPDTLFIGGMHYMKEYNEEIEIPVK